MKSTLLVGALLASITTLSAQEKLPREEALKVTFYLCANLKQLTGTPIPTDPDVKRPVAVRSGDYGGMVLPEVKLNAEVFAKVGKEVSTVGQLWLHKLAPMVDGQVVPASKLRIVHVVAGSGETDAPCCALGVRKNGEGTLELLVYGNDKEPVLRTSLKPISPAVAQENPIEMSAEHQSDGGLVTLKFLGKYEASLMVTDPERQ